MGGAAEMLVTRREQTWASAGSGTGPIALIRSARPWQNRERWGSVEIIPPCRTQRDKGGATESMVTRREQTWASPGSGTGPIALIRSARPWQNRQRWGSVEIIPPCRTQRDKGGATESLVTRREQIWASALQVPQWGLAHTFEFLGPSATTTKAAPLAAVFGEWVPRTPRAWHNSITMQSGAPASPPSAPHSPAPVPLLPKHNDGSCSNSIVPAPVPDRAQLGCDACSEASLRASSP